MVIDAVLTITETSGRQSRFKPFPSDSLNSPVRHGVELVGPWIGVTMTSEVGADRVFLVDVESLGMKAFPSDTYVGELNRDGTLVLLAHPIDAKRWPQMIVRIPSLRCLWTGSDAVGVG